MYPFIVLVNMMLSAKAIHSHMSITGIVIGLKIILLLELPITWLPNFYAVNNSF